MSEKPPTEPTVPPPPALPRRLRWRRRQARAVLLFERVWPALWPPLGLLGAFLCLALLDLPPLLPPVLHALLLLAVAAGGRRDCCCAACGGCALPGDAEADRRLERASGLRHRPLAVLTDRPALPGAEALWRAHVARAAAQVGRLRVGLPRPGLAARDRRALRGGLAVALVAALVIAGPDAPDRLRRALTPRLRARAGAGGDRVAGLDHAARLRQHGAGVPAPRGRRGLGAGRLAPDGQRLRRAAGGRR